jgi:hypothetical protein
MQLAWSFAPALVVEAAVQHGVFERLHQGPRSAAQLAAETGTSIRGLTGILSAWLTEVGYVNPRLLDVPSVSPLVLADKPRS